MKHQAKRFKLGRDTKQRASLWYNLVRSLIMHNKIVTTHAKAKSIVPFVGKVISWGKDDSLSNYRKILAFMRNDEVAAKKVLEYSKQYKERSGGYTRIVRIGQRMGDAAQLSCIMLV